MNLHAIVGPVIAAVNPPIIGVLEVSAGSTTAPDGGRKPRFTTFNNISMQVQALSGREIEHLDSLNIQGVLRAIYFNGNVEGLNRMAGKGGDVLIFPDGRRWVVSQVLETWDTAGWCKVAVALQNP